MGRRANKPRMRGTNAKAQPFYTRAGPFVLRLKSNGPRHKGPQPGSRRGKATQPTAP